MRKKWKSRSSGRKPKHAEKHAEEKKERAKAEKRIIKERARTTIDMALDFGCSNEEILSTLQKKLKVTKQQAEEYLKKFYDKTL